MPCYSPLQGWKDRETGGITFRRDGTRETMEVGCGQCLGCRLDYSRVWAMRITHEASLYELNCFVTLTYRDRLECTEEELLNGYHVPNDWSLNKKHFQDFMKRVRKHFYPQVVRFFHCGEYGNKCEHRIDLELVGCPLCNVGRPHYHAALFNVGFPDREPYGSCNGELRYTSRTLERLWKYGFVDVGELNFESAAYIARYCLKKVTGVRADDHYMKIDLDGVATWVQPEYTTMSRRPGIGRDFYTLYRGDMFPSDEVPVPGSGVFKKVPRYYEELFKIEDPLTLEQIKEVRQVFRKEHADEYTPERLMAKYEVRSAAIDFLTRS